MLLPLRIQLLDTAGVSGTAWVELSMTASSCTELTTPITNYIEGIPIGIGDATISGFGVAMPIRGGIGFTDATTAYTELSIPSTTWAELTF